jgi:hypothetical protein
MVDPNNGDEQVAYRIADGRVPQRPESREYRLVRRLELQYHDGHDYREHRVRECSQPLRGYLFFTHSALAFRLK